MREQSAGGAALGGERSAVEEAAGGQARVAGAPGADACLGFSSV